MFGSETTEAGYLRIVARNLTIYETPSWASGCGFCLKIDAFSQFPGFRKPSNRQARLKSGEPNQFGIRLLAMVL